MVEDEVEEATDDYPEDLKAELDRREEAYKNGTEKTVTRKEMDARIRKMLKK